MTAQQSTKVAVLGCGHWGRNLVRNFAEIGHLGAVNDANAARAKEFGDKFGVPALSVDEILARSDIDGVVIAAPAELHAELALKAIAAGKHVYVEKPLALTTADAEKVIAAADKAGRIVMVGHLLQYHPGFLKLKELVAGGKLGRLQYVYSNRLSLGKIRREENVLWSFAPHDISMILSLVGELPAKVRASGTPQLHPTISDVCTAEMKFASGVGAHVFTSWLHPFKEQRIVIVGEKGMAVFDDVQPWDSKLTLYPHSIDWKGGIPEPVKADAQPVPLEQAEPLKLECQHFIDSISNKTAPRTDGAEGLRVLRVLDAAEQALHGDGWVELDAAPAAKPAYSMHESAYVDDGCEIGKGTKIWHFAHVISGTKIGENCVLGQNVVVGPNVTIGDKVKIQNNVSVYAGVTLEDGVFCGPSCVFTNVINPRAEIERKSEYRPTRVGRGATIGANATIVCGHSLGEYSFVAAGAVVTKDVPPHALVAGVPAKQIGWVSHECERLGDDLVCPRSGKRYAINAQGQLVLAETK